MGCNSSKADEDRQSQRGSKKRTGKSESDASASNVERQASSASLHQTHQSAGYFANEESSPLTAKKRSYMILVRNDDPSVSTDADLESSQGRVTALGSEYETDNRRQLNCLSKRDRTRVMQWLTVIYRVNEDVFEPIPDFDGDKKAFVPHPIGHMKRDPLSDDTCSNTSDSLMTTTKSTTDPSNGSFLSPFHGGESPQFIPHTPGAYAISEYSDGDGDTVNGKGKGGGQTLELKSPGGTVRSPQPHVPDQGDGDDERGSPCYRAVIPIPAHLHPPPEPAVVA